MNKAIKTYNDLLQEEQRLQAQLALHKTLIQQDMTDIKTGVKEKLNPLKKIRETVNHLFVNEGKNGPALNFMLNFVLDFIIRIFIPKRTSVWTKTIIPFITKNYVSHLITDEQRKSISLAINKYIGKADHFIRNTIINKQEDNYRTAAHPSNIPPVNTNPI